MRDGRPQPKGGGARCFPRVVGHAGCLVEHRVVGSLLKGQLDAGVQVDGVVAARAGLAGDGGMEHAGSKVGAREGRVASVRGVEVVEEVARNRRVVPISNHAVVDGLVGQPDRGDPNGMTGSRDVLGVSSVPLREASLHGGEVVVERVQAVPVPITPGHEQHGLSAFISDGTAQGNGGVFAVLPHAVGGGEGGHLALVLEHDVVPR